MLSLQTRLPWRATLRLRRKRVASVVILLIFVGCWFIWLRPAVLGGPLTFITVSGTSMQPTMYTGDLAIVYKRSDYHVGDVIVYRIQTPSGQGSVVIHRIVGGDAEHGFLTQGDHNKWKDPWHPKPTQIQGAMWVHIGGVGKVVTIIAQPMVLGSLMASLTVFLILLGGGETEKKRGNLVERKGEVSKTGVSS